MTRFSFQPDHNEMQEDPEDEAADIDGGDEATDEQVESRRQQLAAMQAQVEELRRNQQRADQEKLNALEKKKRAAVAAGDTEEYDQLRQQEAEIYRDLASRGQAGKPSNSGSPNRARSGKRDWNSIPAADRKLLEQEYFKRDTRKGKPATYANRMADTPETRARVAKSYRTAKDRESNQ